MKKKFRTFVKYVMQWKLHSAFVCIVHTFANQLDWSIILTEYFKRWHKKGNSLL